MTVTWNTQTTLARARKGAMRGVVAATEEVRNEALRLILDTPKTGRVYRRRGIEHQASAPGEPPASDIGRLVGSIRTDYSKLDSLIGQVMASTTYAPYLEYGTARMAARPYMRPALANMKKVIEEKIQSAVAAALVG